MEVIEYINQAYLLDKAIQSDQEELNRLRVMSMSIPGVQYAENLFHSENTNARFVKLLFKIDEYKKLILDEMTLLIELKREMLTIINTVPVLRDRLVLKYRHLKNYRWEEIADEFSVNEKTVRRWHREAISYIRLPEKHVDLDEILKNVRKCPTMSGI